MLARLVSADDFVALCTMLNEIRIGCVSEGTRELFCSLDRPLMDGNVAATELFPTRHEVDRANAVRMGGLCGPVVRYEAADSGKLLGGVELERTLEGCMAPKRLLLKPGAQVMLLKNMDESLVNGSVGIVLCFCKERDFNRYAEGLVELAELDGVSCAESVVDGVSCRLWPVVAFRLVSGGERVVMCSPEDWKLELPTGEILAQRRQVPLLLAWALSIHKSQGQTLHRVSIDLRRVFETGQAYVALSRATSRDGLWVRNFRDSAVMVDDRVVKFYRGLDSVA